MILIYRILINLFFPLIIFIIFFRTILKKEDKNRYKEKLFSSSFDVKRDNRKKLIWFHAASIGELKSIVPIIEKINKKNKFQFLITTVTISSAKLFQKNLFRQKNIIHRFFPIDKISLVRNFLDHWSPNLVIFVDSEVWPNFVLEIKKRDKPLILLNSRITKKTFNRWNLLAKFSKKIFQSFDLCISSSKESKKYLEKFKVKNIKYFGNLKLASKIQLKSSAKESYFKKNKIWCAVSTHDGEELLCLKSHLELKKKYKNIVTILIPRHIQRTKSINSLCKSLSLKSQILEIGHSVNTNAEILIVNSYGSTTKYLNLCKSVFIGKSLLEKLEKVGGQNPIEAAKLGCKIYHGPYVYNFQEIYDLLKNHKIAEKIKNKDELVNKLSNDFNKSKKKDIKKIDLMNNLGKNILNKTYVELLKHFNYESNKT